MAQPNHQASALSVKEEEEEEEAFPCQFYGRSSMSVKLRCSRVNVVADELNK